MPFSLGWPVVLKCWKHIALIILADFIIVCRNSRACVMRKLKHRDCEWPSELVTRTETQDSQFPGDVLLPYGTIVFYWFCIYKATLRITTAPETENQARGTRVLAIIKIVYFLVYLPCQVFCAALFTLISTFAPPEQHWRCSMEINVRFGGWIVWGCTYWFDQ